MLLCSAKRKSAAKKAPSGPGAEVVGQHVEIHWEAEKQWYDGTIAKYNTRAGTHTVDYDDGESFIHDLGKTEFRASAGEDDDAEGDDAADAGNTSSGDLVAALLPQEGDCLSILWDDGKGPQLCILRMDQAGDLIPYPVDESWEDEDLVFDAAEDEWSWPSDELFENAQIGGGDRSPSAPSSPAATEQAFEENAPMHPLATSMQLAFCVIAVGVGCFMVDPVEREKLLEQFGAVLSLLSPAQDGVQDLGDK